MTITVVAPPANFIPYAASCYPERSGWMAAQLDYSFLNDGVYDNLRGYASPSGDPNWVKADLGSPQFVKTVYVGGGRINGWGDTTPGSVGAVLSYSNDNATWTTAHVYSSVFSTTGTAVDVNRTARYWRLSHTRWFGTTEFRFEGIPMAPVVNGPFTTSAVVGSGFGYTVTASGNPTSFGATGLPAGLSINTTSGLIAGTMSTAGTFSIGLSATNSAGTGAATLTLTSSYGPPSITSPTSAQATVGLPFSYQITAANAPTGFGAAGLPAGLSVNAATGLINGVPTTYGTSNVQVSATNPAGTAVRTVAISTIYAGADSDGDGVDSTTELMLGLDPLNPADVRVFNYTYDKANQLKIGPGGEYMKDAEGNVKKVQ